MQRRVCCGPAGAQTLKESSEGPLLDPHDLSECWRTSTLTASQQPSAHAYLEPHAPKQKLLPPQLEFNLWKRFVRSAQLKGSRKE